MTTPITRIGNVQRIETHGQDVTFILEDGARTRISILADDLVRVRIDPQGEFADNISQAVIATDWPEISVAVDDSDDEVTLTTEFMKLIVHKRPFRLECRDASGRLVVTDSANRPIEWSEYRTEVFKTIQPGERYVGLGWRPTGLVRNGTRFVMRNKPTYDDPEVFYSGVPIWYGLREGAGVHAIFFDDMSWGTIDLGATDTKRLSFRNLGGQIDYYYFAGPMMQGILDRFTELTGRPYMPPRWSVGYQQCRWSYTPQSQLEDIARELRSREIPCDVIYLDIDYMPGGHALTFDPETFPEPTALLKTLHEMGLHTVANISPLLLADDPKLAEARDKGLLLMTAGGAPHKGRHFYWDEFGGGKTGEAYWLDFSKSATREWWADKHKDFMAHGIDGIWNDLNEPDELGADWPEDLKYDFDGRPTDHRKTSPQYPLLQSGMSYDLLKRLHPNRRPFVISRGGCAGIQRYATLWTGDNGGGWEVDYRRNIAMGLSMSISGNPHNGHDIGGYFGSPTHDDAPEPELYARWMQSGVFSPFCRQHHDGFGNLADPPRPFAEPWRFGPQVEQICRDYIQLRYRLMPYLYTLFYNAHTTGDPVQRPTLYDFPNDPNTLTQDDDFMFGPAMLVSPVTEPRVTEWETYLPVGSAWIDYWTDAVHEGGRKVTTETPLSRLPIFLRDGAIIPMGPVRQYDDETPCDMLTLETYPTGGVSSFTLYEDDGISWDYLEGGFCQTTYSMVGLGEQFRFMIHRRHGRFPPADRDYHLKVHRFADVPNGVLINDEPLPAARDIEELAMADAAWYYGTEVNVLHVKFPDEGRQVVVGIG